MTNTYETIDFFGGNTLEECINELLSYKEKGVLVCAEFNDGTKRVTLYSDTVTVDSAYLEITGKTKSEFDKERKEWKEAYNKQKREYLDKIPELTNYWIAKGKEVLNEDKWELWSQIVHVRLADYLYGGSELDNSLEVLNILNNNGTLEEAKEKLESQGHSGTSFDIVLSIVSDLYER